MKSSIIPVSAQITAQRNGGALANIARHLLLKRLADLKHGELRIVEDGVEQRFGTRDAQCNLSATVWVDHPGFFADVAFAGSVGAGEAYIQGQWRCSDLTSLVRILVVNRDLLNGLEGGWAWLCRPVLRAFHWSHRSSRSGSARNIAAHYDLGNELYALMLDETMAYSCGIFECADSTLAEASRAKFAAACEKLALGPEDHLLEIGTGWGGLAIYAAQNYGCRVTTTTISQAQYDYSRELVTRLGLNDRITLLLEDYRDLKGQYDKLVSIEMIEAVGAQYLDTYLRKCSSLLKPEGAMLLQAITIQDQAYAQALRSVDFIQRYVFPGSFIPSITAIADSLRRVTDLKIFNLEDIGPHYARTLALWRENFKGQLDAVRRLGYSEQFIRLWEFYLCYCEGGFLERQLGDVQMLLTKPRSRRAVIATS